jgi:large subunit ribosomal protein L9
MKIILTEDVHQIGYAGDIKEVKPGFARNFLLPNRLAIAATPAALREWDKAKDAREARRSKAVEAAKASASKIDGTALSFARPVGEGGKLFGSVGRADIAKSLSASGFTVDKTQVDLENPFKEVGEYEVTLRLRPGVSAKVKVSVVPRA